MCTISCCNIFSLVDDRKRKEREDEGDHGPPEVIRLRKETGRQAPSSLCAPPCSVPSRVQITLSAAIVHSNPTRFLSLYWTKYLDPLRTDVENLLRKEPSRSPTTLHPQHAIGTRPSKADRQLLTLHSQRSQRSGLSPSPSKGKWNLGPVVIPSSMLCQPRSGSVRTKPVTLSTKPVSVIVNFYVTLSRAIATATPVSRASLLWTWVPSAAFTALSANDSNRIIAGILWQPLGRGAGESGTFDASVRLDSPMQRTKWPGRLLHPL